MNEQKILEILYVYWKIPYGKKRFRTERFRTERFRTEKFRKNFDASGEKQKQGPPKLIWARSYM